MNSIADEQIAHTIQFHHPEKTLALKMPGITDEQILAALLGITVDRYRQICQRFTHNTIQAAAQLLADPSFAVLVDRLPFAPNSTIVGLGDSLTDDRQSWLEILRQLLHIRRPADQIKIINAGNSGDTTNHLISRFHYVSPNQPDWIICLAGTNDVRRHGRSPNQVLVSITETTKNLQMLRRLAATQTQARWIWMTPPQVIEPERVDQSAELVESPAQWLNTDLETVAAVIRQQTDPIVDLQPIFGCPAHPQFFLADGLHPSLDGQQTIVSTLVKNLAALSR